MTTPNPFSLHFIQEGEGLPVLLVHGLHASLHDWDSLILPLSMADYRVYACDLLGHGESPHPPDPRMYYAQMLFSSFRGWMDSLKLKLAPIMIGHGLGAYLCMRYAIGHPYKVNKLILINPLLMPEQLSPLVMQFSRHLWLERLALRFAPDWTARKLLGLPPKKNQKLDERVLAGYRDASPFNLRIHASISDLTPEIPDLPTQSLYIWGEADPLFNMSLLPALIEEIPEVLAYALEGVGHRPHLENPEQTNQLITDFLLGL